MIAIDRNRLDTFDPAELIGDDPRTDEAALLQRASHVLLKMRLRADLTQEALADRLHISAAQLKLLESGQSPDGPTVGLLARAAQVCGFGKKLKVTMTLR